MSAQKSKRKVEWGQLFFGTLWLTGAALIFVLYQTGNLTGEIPIPRVVLLVYEFLGIELGSLVQAAISLLLIITSFKKTEA